MNALSAGFSGVLLFLRDSLMQVTPPDTVFSLYSALFGSWSSHLTTAPGAPGGWDDGPQGHLPTEITCPSRSPAGHGGGRVCLQQDTEDQQRRPE